MKIKKLYTLSQFVELIHKQYQKDDNDYNALRLIVTYADFLKERPTNESMNTILTGWKSVTNYKYTIFSHVKLNNKSLWFDKNNGSQFCVISYNELSEATKGKLPINLEL